MILCHELQAGSQFKKITKTYWTLLYSIIFKNAECVLVHRNSFKCFEEFFNWLFKYRKLK
ncbi:unnamed protein product [Tenebrio molitor]|nr:unnamed protein product [Tenebrio molitor]